MSEKQLISRINYIEGQKEAAHRVLIELSNLFQQYKEEICIIGGWVPNLMFPEAGHIGSIDVDILINQMTLKDEGYLNMSKILLRNGYRKHTVKYFTYVKTINICDVSYDVDVDILAGMYGGTTTKRSQHVQGLRALKATGGNLAFEIPAQEIEIDAKRPDDSMDHTTLNVVAVVPYFIMKTAAMGRGKPKDAYDMYFLLLNYAGGVKALANEFIPYENRAIVREMIEKLHYKFHTENHAGVQDVIDFMALESVEDIELLRRDVFERFSIFLKLLETSTK